MTFTTIESSNEQGRPIFLYAFTLGAATWRYTSSDADVTLQGYKWTATAISDNGVKLSGEATADSLEITAPSTIAPAQMFLGTPPSQAIMVSIYHYHEGDTNAVLGYVGEVYQVNQPQPGTAIITCDTISASMQRDGLRLGWQRNCPYALYDELTCKADKAAHVKPLVVVDIVDNQVSFNGLEGVDDGTFDGGFIEWVHPSRGLEFRSIEKQTGSTCEMFGLADGLYYGLAVNAYPGCARTTADCVDKFDNLDNYGGVPDLPGKSPFDGDPVF
jgi:uncharacterized phage protein (TIGR02218 family)